MSTDILDQDCRGLKVLVVDDKSINRDLIKKILIEEGMIVIGEAREGQEACDLFEALKPDLVTMDINMPNVNGLRAIKKIMQIDKNANIVVVSGYQNSENKAREFGAKDFLAKPFQPAFLINKIKKLVMDGAFGTKEEPHDEAIIDISVSPENQQPTQGVRKAKKKQISVNESEVERIMNTGPRSPESIILSDDEDDDYDDDLLASIDFDTGENIEILDIKENVVFMIDDEEEDDMFIEIPSNPPELIVDSFNDNLVIDTDEFHLDSSKEPDIKKEVAPKTNNVDNSTTQAERPKRADIMIKPPLMNPTKEETRESSEDLIIHTDGEIASTNTKNKSSKQPKPQKEKKGLFGLLKKSKGSDK